MRCVLCEGEKKVEEVRFKAVSIPLCSNCRRKWETGRIPPEALLEAMLMQTRLKFPEGNKILYGQDFALWVGVPHDVEFEVVRVERNGMWLKGPGYGGGPYGNGPILVFFKTAERGEQDADS